MIKFFTNRELAQKLGINLAKWKRWSREFLPPDPLGGMQSGYARHYSLDEAFRVFLGGYLVATLKYTIPEAKKILQDMQKWMGTVGLYRNSGSDVKMRPAPEIKIKNYVVFIRQQSLDAGQSIGFLYAIRGLISTSPIAPKDLNIRQERYIERFLPPRQNYWAVSEVAGVKMLNISQVLGQFVEALGLPKALYAAMNDFQSRKDPSEKI